MDKNNKDCQHGHHGGGFSTGFLFGFILGGVVVFLLGTQKGKQIMQTLAENGFEGISDILEDEEDDGEYEEYVDDTPGPEDVSSSSEELSPAPIVHEKRVVVVHHHPRTTKRLFRGIRK